MPTKQGDLTLLNDPVAQELLHSTIPARLAYVWRDGTPRVVPIWFHWNGAELVLGTPLQALKGQTWVEQVRTLFPRMARIVVRPEWVGLLDFTTRFPGVIAAAMSGV